MTALLGRSASPPKARASTLTPMRVKNARASWVPIPGLKKNRIVSVYDGK